MSGLIPFEVHEAFLPLLEAPHTYADIHGGRYGMKTEQVHKISLKRAMHEPVRVLGVRETMAAIKDSSHKTLSDLIYSHQMATSQNGPFEVQTSAILRKEGDRVESEFIFVGVRENVRDRKSIANIDLVIFDEAGKCSKDSLDIFLPTVIRKPGCKAWFIWNPELVTDPIYQFFNEPPKGTIKIETDYRDNPWLSEEALNLVEHTRVTAPEDYEHIYLGKALSEIKGAIFGAEMKAALADGRICKVPYNRNYPVDTAWDLGYHDKTAIWFIQAVDGWYNFIDYYENSGEAIHHYLVELQRRGYVYGYHYLPHDALDTIIHGNLSGDKTRSIEGTMRAAGLSIRMIAKIRVVDQINAARTICSQCRFDESKCIDGLRALRMYQWGPPTPLGVYRREPLHDDASHGASAFCGAAWCVKQPRKEPAEKKTPAIIHPPRIPGAYTPFG